jgi:hypothetical protein
MATIYYLGDSSVIITVLASDQPFVNANDQFNFNSLSGIIVGISRLRAVTCINGINKRNSGCALSRHYNKQNSECCRT